MFRPPGAVAVLQRFDCTIESLHIFLPQTRASTGSHTKDQLNVQGFCDSPDSQMLSCRLTGWHQNPTPQRLGNALASTPNTCNQYRVVLCASLGLGTIKACWEEQNNLAPFFEAAQNS